MRVADFRHALSESKALRDIIAPYVLALATRIAWVTRDIPNDIVLLRIAKLIRIGHY
jgi:hypothetical protein